MTPAFHVSEDHDSETDKQIQVGHFSRNWKEEEAMDIVADKMESGVISIQVALREGRKLMEKYPANLEIINFVGCRQWDLELRDEAAETWERAYTLGASVIPKTFKGRIEWGHHNNRAFLRCVYGYILGLSHLGKFKQALILAKKTLKWSPDDNMGVRYLVPDLQYGSGDLKPALKSYLSEAVDQPTLWYSAGLIEFEQGNHVQACTYIRRGILGNPYVAEGLLGRIKLQDHLYWHGSNLYGTDFALDYLSAPIVKWSDAAIDFVDWVFNSSIVLNERAKMMELHEMLTYERDPIQRSYAVHKQAAFVESINDDVSKVMVKRVHNRWNQEVFPWDRTGLKSRVREQSGM